ncbi:branched-chain amino acid transaminase [Miniphocaeibacter massiliensis]|uniref:branched-chain amino acid transaminase n=1 Tax=Miniphocaeibacter massiliensis TaxID=2041841 RepID=UPI000C1B7DC9|nr:branched-chain amino acid transaminase [Miniphocaeibacter massiliensis]
MTQKVFYQGKIVDESSVSISLRSKAFNYGLACFEGIRAYWDDETQQLYGFCMKEHYDRLLESCKCLNMEIPYTSEELCNYTIELLKANNCKTTTYIRPVVYKGAETLKPSLIEMDDRIVIYTQPLDSYSGKEELRVAVSSWRRISDTSLPPRTKATAGYLNSALAGLEVISKGYDEAIFLTNAGYVCEGPGENIFFVKNGKLLTPPPSDDILEGITRGLVMKLAEEELGIEVVERSMARTELYNSQEVFFSGTAMEVTAVVEADDRKIGTGKQGEVCKKLKDLFKQVGVGKIEKYKYLTMPVW